MNFKALAACAAISMLAALPASASTLFDVVGLADDAGSYNLAFVATGAATNLSFGGYNLPSVDVVGNIGVYLNDAGSNLLGLTWNFTPAPLQSLAFQGGIYGVGSAGTNNLSFLGASTGSYDIFDQTFASVSGANYNVRFNLRVNENQNALRVLTDGGAVPEPATWALMIIGFGAAGSMIRRRKDVVA